MTQELEVLEVPIDLIAQPHLPLILADKSFLATLKAVEATVASIKITDAVSAQAAADLQARLTNAGTKLEVSRKTLVQPYLDMQRKINDTAKDPAARIDAAKATLKQALALYEQARREAAEAAEIKRQEELAALERKRQQEAEVERQRIAELEKQALEKQQREAEALAKSKTRVMDFEEEEDEEPEPEPPQPSPPTAVEQQIAAIKAAPATVASAPSGVRFITTLKIRGLDMTKLPDTFCIKTANERAIVETFCRNWKKGDPIPECPGVTFRIDETVASTGRERF